MKTNAVWFVTGASKGLGLSLVKALLARGHRIAATSRSASALTKVVGPENDRFLPLEMDVLDEASVARAVERTKAHFGGLDVVVNNAGYGQLGAVEELTDAEARKNFDVNVFGPLNVFRAALPLLRAQRSGHVFNVSSIGGYVGAFSGWGVYCSTKFALSGLTESLHADLAPLGVRVTLVYPGYFRTEFLSEGSVVRPSRPIADYEAARASEQAHVETIHHNQPGDPDRLAQALIQTYEAAEPPLHLFLGSDAVAMAEARTKDLLATIETHRALGQSTDFPG